MQALDTLPGDDAQNDEPILVLVVDDNRTNRMVLNALLQRQGYRVCFAEHGEQAIDVFEEQNPDLILMDVMMPVMDGYEATQQIKKLSGERFVPVIFVTALTDEQALVKCIDAGGDDFLSKPYNKTILQAKIEALMRLRALYETQMKQKEQLSYYHEHMMQEQRVAERMFSNIVHHGCLDSENLHYSISPMAIFNGDLLIAAKAPSGSLHLLLGDFTGHGLAASIGAMPASEIFYGMTAKGFGVGDIVNEINTKLNKILPTGQFLATVMLEFNPATSTITIWNGGLPDVLMFDREQGIKRRFNSKNVPLGVLNQSMFDRSVEIIEVAPSDSLFLYTDGVIEAENAHQEFFGQQRLEDYFERFGSDDTVMERVKKGLEVFQEGVDQGDDITFIQIDCYEPESDGREREETGNQQSRASGDWHMEMKLTVPMIRQVDPMPLLVQMLMEIQGLYKYREHIYTILTELFLNALEHGVLGLDSSLKATPDGFMNYYTAKQERLEQMDEGFVHIRMRHSKEGDGGCLELTLEDSGPGFDINTRTVSLEENMAPSGRGIPLLQKLCSELNYNETGNRATAIYRWK